MNVKDTIGAGLFIVGCLLLGNGLLIGTQLSEPYIYSRCDVMYEEEFTECLKTYQRIEVIENITVLWAPECVEYATYTNPIVDCNYFKELDPRTPIAFIYMRTGFYVLLASLFIIFVIPYFKREKEV